MSHVTRTPGIAGGPNCTISSMLVLVYGLSLSLPVSLSLGLSLSLTHTFDLCSLNA